LTTPTAYEFVATIIRIVEEEKVSQPEIAEGDPTTILAAAFTRGLATGVYYERYTPEGAGEPSAGDRHE
jgi:hypothetical protein